MLEHEPLPVYTALDVTRCGQLDHVSQLLSRTMPRVKDSPGHRYEETAINYEGQLFRVIMTPRFLYGVWRIRQTLVENLTQAGHRESALDIVAKYARRR